MRQFAILFLVLLVACRPSGQGFEVHTHPDGALYTGDRVSFEVLPPAGFETGGQTVRISVDEIELGRQEFAPFGVGQRMQATFLWSWDTRDLPPGDYALTFSVAPDGPTWSEELRLRPSDSLPPPGPEARWEMAESDCCLVYFITGTDAERDLPFLLQMVDEQAAAVEAQMGSNLESVIEVSFLSRTLGHGGFAGDGIYVSYLDENYAGGLPSQIIRHEMVHDLDSSLGGSYRPSILVEGLAVHLSGGHYKPEPLLERAAALLELGWFIPLATLADDFYFQQHEVGYLEAGALVCHLVEVYGWESFETFYRSIEPPGDQAVSQALDRALQAHFGVSLAGLEQDFVARLEQHAASEGAVTDLRLTVVLYDTIRRYQQAFDPSAHFLTAWLADGNAMRQEQIVADYLRHPERLSNRAIESLLLEAHQALLVGDYARLARILDWTNLLLDILT
ncbi:MAG: hypothetical protein FJZ96_01430 [Chloroflexi bacterium]|nr:hypothetical protein [Chloroflexota bacterium]